MIRKKLVLITALFAVMAVGAMAHAGQATTTNPGAATAAKPAAAPAKHGYGLIHAPAPKLDLNGASREELMKLQGMTEAMADKIVAARPFVSKRALVSRKIITSQEYSKIAARVMVKHEPLAGKTHK